MSTLSPVKLKQPGGSSPSKSKAPAPINWVPKVSAATDFLGFCNSLDIITQAAKEGTRVPDLRQSRPSQKPFFENLTSWVETYKNTEETLDKDKRKPKETPEDDNDDMMSKLNETQSVAQTAKKSVMGGLKKSSVLDGLQGLDGSLPQANKQRSTCTLTGREKSSSSFTRLGCLWQKTSTSTRLLSGRV